MAILGKLKSATELKPVMSSGNEVTEANRMIPTQVRPMPVFSAITSPYFERLAPP
jgi:hypothetical protein